MGRICKDYPVVMKPYLKDNPYDGTWTAALMIDTVTDAKKSDYVEALRRVLENKKSWDFIKDRQMRPEKPYKKKKGNRMGAIALKWKVFKQDGFKCKTCRADENLEVDHIKPVSKGGSNKLENLQTLCRRCNAHKHAKYNG